jgi:hypothetical protein
MTKSIAALRLGTVVLVGAFSALLINYLLPSPVWTQGDLVKCVLNNWYDYGYLELKGHFVMNAGGINQRETPVRHEASTGLGLLPLHLLHLMTGDLLVALRLFLILLTMVLALSIWVFLGKTPAALAAATAFCFSPGYIQKAVDWDVNPGTVLLGIPLLICFLKVLESNRQSNAVIGVWLLLIAGYVQIEWATGFAIFILWSTVVAIWWRTNRRRVILFTAFLAVVLLLCVTAKVFAKAASQSGAGGSVFLDTVRYLGTMTVGRIGYDGKTPMSWGLALRRMVSVDLVGLLPLWLMFAWVIARSPRGNGRGTLLKLTPLLASGLSVLVMRNYFVPHKWIQMPILGMGILFSMHLFLGANDQAAVNQESKLSAPVSLRIPALLVFALGSFLYCLVILTVFKVNNAERHALVAVVSENTPRHALVVIGPNLGPCLAADPRPEYAAGLLDRKTVEAQAPVRQMTEVAESKAAYFVDSEPLPELGVPLATSEAARIEWIEKLLGWYRQNIAKWTAKTRPTLPSQYYLYRIAAPHLLPENTRISDTMPADQARRSI